MMNLPPSVEVTGPVDAAILDTIQEAAGVLPSVLVALYRETNGLRSASGAVLYRAEELLERNSAYETALYAPGYLAIGDDGEGRVVLLSADGTRAVLADAGDLNPLDGHQLADGLVAWLDLGLPLPSDDAEHPTEVHVFLERAPAGGASDLLIVKRGLGLSIGIRELLGLSRQAPVQLLEGVAYGKYLVRCRRINEVADCLTLRDARDPTHYLPTRGN